MKPIAEYALSDHLVVYSEGCITIYKREASARPARKRIMDVVELAPHQRRAAMLHAKYAGRRTHIRLDEQAAFEDAEWEAHKAREEQARLLRLKYGGRR